MKTHVANSGHKYLILWNSTYSIFFFYAFSASARSTVSVLLPLNILCTGWIAASPPVSYAAHNCKDCGSLMTSFLAICTTSFPAIFRVTSQTWTGLEPGFLCNGISLHAKNTYWWFVGFSICFNIFIPQSWTKGWRQINEIKQNRFSMECCTTAFLRFFIKKTSKYGFWLDGWALVMKSQHVRNFLKIS